jgi:hypothetical protein
VCVSPVSETPAGPGGLMGPVAASLTKPSHAPSSSSSSSSSTPIPTKPRTSGNLATAAPPLVTPAEAAADAGAGWGAWLLCWRGFRAPGAEGAFQSYRGAALRRWDWVCRLSVLVLGAGLTVKKMQLLEGPWAGGTTAPGEWVKIWTSYFTYQCQTFSCATCAGQPTYAARHACLAVPMVAFTAEVVYAMVKR